MAIADGNDGGIVLTGVTDEAAAASLGVYLEREGEECNGRPVYARDDATLLYYAGGTWWVNDVLGETAGFIHSSQTDASTPTLAPRGEWSVASEVGLVVAPGLRCVTRANYAEEMAQLLAKHAPASALRLVGPTPDGAQVTRLGPFARRKDELYNFRPVYCQVGTEDELLYFAGGRWWVNDILGETSGFLHSACDDAVTPEASAAGGWSVAIEAGLAEAPQLRAVAEEAYAEEIAAALEHASPSQVLVLSGQTPGGGQASKLGEYRLLGGESCDHRPVWAHVPSNGAFVLSHVASAWWVGTKVGVPSGVAVSAPSEGVSPEGVGEWRVASEGGLCPAPDVRCTSEASHLKTMASRLADEHAAPIVFVYGSTPRGAQYKRLGEYRVRPGELHEARPVYTCVGDTALNLYHAAGRWYINDVIGAAEGFLRSAETDCMAAEHAPSRGWVVASDGWCSAPDVACTAEAPPTREYVRRDRAFVDGAFPPDAQAVAGLTSKAGTPLIDCWVRAPELLEGVGDGEAAQLWDAIAPMDIIQAQLGHCWLMAVLSAVAEFPELIRARFTASDGVRADGVSADGRYGISLYSLEKGAWLDVEIDDYIPAAAGYGTPHPVFAMPVGGELWVLLIEKAVAKYVGSYSGLVGGHAAWAMLLLLGPPSATGYRQPAPSGGGSSGTGWLTETLVDVESTGGCKWATSGATPMSDSQLFDALASSDLEQCVMTCVSEMALDEANAVGIVTEHVYSVLTVLQVGDMQLLRLRNPHGDHEWKGDWSDESALWSAHPDVAQAAGHLVAEDGLFWMSLADFCHVFGARVAVQTTTRAFEHACIEPQKRQPTRVVLDGGGANGQARLRRALVTAALASKLQAGAHGGDEEVQSSSIGVVAPKVRRALSIKGTADGELLPVGSAPVGTSGEEECQPLLPANSAAKRPPQAGGSCACAIL